MSLLGSYSFLRVTSHDSLDLVTAYSLISAPHHTYSLPEPSLEGSSLASNAGQLGFSPAQPPLPSWHPREQRVVPLTVQAEPKISLGSNLRLFPLSHGLSILGVSAHPSTASLHSPGLRKPPPSVLSQSPMADPPDLLRLHPMHGSTSSGVVPSSWPVTSLTLCLGEPPSCHRPLRHGRDFCSRLSFPQCTWATSSPLSDSHPILTSSWPLSFLPLSHAPHPH